MLAARYFTYQFVDIVVILTYLHIVVCAVLPLPSSPSNVMISSSSSLSSLEISENVQPGWVLLSSHRDGRVFEVLRMTKLCQCLAWFDFVLPLTWRGLTYRIYLGAFIESMCAGAGAGVLQSSRALVEKVWDKYVYFRILLGRKVEDLFFYFASLWFREFWKRFNKYLMGFKNNKGI